MHRYFALPTLVATFALNLFSPSQLHGQAGDLKDAPNSVQTEIWKEIDTPPAPILTPEEALKTFHIESGFHLELVASEPLVNDPVAIAWDKDGRLWVCEFWAYMPNAEGEGEHEPVGRVVVLEDLDGDGTMDRSTVFLDGLVMPRSIAIVEGGVLIGDPPGLLFCEDLDGDLKSDRETLVAKYGVSGNVEHAENGLMQGMDNWLYNARSSRRMRFQNDTFTEELTNMRGQWGISMDDYGRIFYNTNSVMLMADTRPWNFLNKHSGWTPSAGFNERLTEDNSVSSIRVNPGINRAYRPNWLAPDHRIKKADAASAPSIYRGNKYPKSYHGNAFVPEPSGNLVARYQLEDNDLSITPTKKLNEHPKWGLVDFLASTDERFRPVATKTGPDGFLYVVDMYRGILQHKTYLTSFLKKQIIERGLDAPVGLGRIYRVVHETDTAKRSVPSLSKYNNSKLVTALSSENGWTRDTAQRLLIQRGNLNKATLAKLKKLSRTGNEIPQIHALWTLQGLGEIDEDILLAAMENGTNWTKSHAWRIATELSESESLLEYLRSDLNSPFKRLRLEAFSAARQLLPTEEVIEQISNRGDDDLSDPYFQDAFISSLSGIEYPFVQYLDEHPNLQSPAINNLAAKLGLATYQANTTAELPTILVNGPATTAFTSAFQAAKTKADSVVEIEYRPNQLASIERGKTLYQSICASCHLPNGQGAPGLAPPLAGSEWVTGSRQRLIVSVYHGLEGPIQVNDTDWNLVMPAHGPHPSLQGQNMADVLSYIRSAWNNNSRTISEWDVHEATNPHRTRATPWTLESLIEHEL